MLRNDLVLALILGNSMLGCGTSSSETQDPSSVDSGSNETGLDAIADSSGESASDSNTNVDSSLDTFGDSVSDGSLDAGTNIGPISGAIIHVGYGASDDGLPVQEIPTLFDELKSLGMDTLVINQTRVKRSDATCFGGASDFEWVAGFPSKLGIILDAAHARGMKVWAGTTMSTTACSTFYLPPNADLVRKDVATHMAELYKDWGTHPAFAGWYIPDEPGQLLSFQDGYYYNVTYELKQIDKDLPVMVCPYLVAVVQSPTQLANRALEFQLATGIDIQAWQDSVGADATKLSYWARTGYSLTEYFTALSGSLGDGLWADTELFNWGNPLFNPKGMTGGYRSTSAVRIQAQLDETQLAKKRISWLPQYHMSSFGPSKGYPESTRLLAAYRALHGFAGKKIETTAYEWLSNPSATYPDTLGLELIDGKVGDPKNVSDPGWTGIQGSAELVLDLGQGARVDWVSVHALVMPSWSIAGPSVMHLSCSADKKTYGTPHDTQSPIVSGDYSDVKGEEYVFSNMEPLNETNCRYLRMSLENTSWTFMGEVEVYAE